MTAMPWRRLAALAGASALMACASPATSAPPAAADPTASPSTAVIDLVGEWERDTHCTEIVNALRDAEMDLTGLDYAAAYFAGGEIADPAHPCDGAVPLRHSHFFTATGRFGSRDENGNQVDDGTYRIVDDDTLVISNHLGSDTLKQVTFHYEIEDGELSLEPVIPDCRPDCFEAVWSVTVAYAGHTWTRIMTE